MADKELGWVTKEEACRKLEEHLSVLVDYDVLQASVADMLTEHIWRIVGSINVVLDVDSLFGIGKQDGTD